MGKKSDRWASLIREVIRRDPRSLYRIALDAAVSYPQLHRFMTGERDLGLAATEDVCRAVGLELRKVKRERGRASGRKQ